ncbi:MAG: DegT/DnrJ/EryC1/StrS family aminotransferase [Desulfobacca sp.]|nr:DegT/DnrJ/EryC1/StrS family aminotransferase [Desulfobacca sp.]
MEFSTKAHHPEKARTAPSPSAIPIVHPTLHDFEEVVAEFRQAWDQGQVTTGVFTRRFEVAVEEKLQVPHAIMVQSCTAGLMLALRALDLTGEVILPAFSWTATAHAVVWNGLTPVFADILPGTLTLNPEAVAKAITPQTAAIMPVNVFGCPPEYQAFARLANEHKLPLVYDTAQGLGSQVQTPDGSWVYAGGFGQAEVFSMSPTKVVSAMEGGLITTTDAELAQKLRQMRDYGKTADASDIAWLGLSARVPEINAITARHNFAHLEDLISRRQALVALYQESLQGLAGTSWQHVPTAYRSSWNYLTMFIDEQQARAPRDAVYEHLQSRNIQTKKYFYPALHLQKVYRQLGEPYRGTLPVTEAAAVAGLALPLYSHMTEDTVQRVVHAVREILT